MVWAILSIRLPGITVSLTWFKVFLRGWVLGADGVLLWVIEPVSPDQHRVSWLFFSLLAAGLCLTISMQLGLWIF